MRLLQSKPFGSLTDYSDYSSASGPCCGTSSSAAGPYAEAVEAQKQISSGEAAAASTEFDRFDRRTAGQLTYCYQLSVTVLQLSTGLGGEPKQVY